jgi:hypothetical protein
MDWKTQLKRAAARRQRADDAAERALADLYDAIEAARDAGAGYQQIADLVGVSRIRVGQVLAARKGDADAA